MFSQLIKFSGIASFICNLFGFLLLASQTAAQIIPDNTLGNESSVVVPNQNIRGINSDRIDGGAVRGGNLFHSFQEFNVDVGRGAYFSNPDSVVNILTRVTGDNISNILGTLGILGNANLFLINPNGIVFGPNARLDVGGSFFGSTADGILFENGVEFAASNPEAPPLLTINIPLGFNIRENPGSIVNQATLTTSEDGSPLRDNNGFLIPQGLNVPQNQTLALVGGNVLFDNGVAISPGSNIEIGGLSEPGIVKLNNVEANGNTPSLQFPDNIQQSNIALTNESQINIRADDGGDININAGNFEMSGGSIVRAGIDAGLGSPEARGGDVNINAQDSVIFTDPGSSIRNNIDSNATGKPGNININTNSLLIENAAFLNTTTFGTGNTGNVTIQASDSVQIINSTGINSGVNDNSVGNGGTVEINTARLELLEGGQIIAGSRGQGNPGNIIVRASDAVTISGVTPDGQFLSALVIDIEENAVGNGGNILVETNQLRITDEGVIVAQTTGEGHAGNITIRATELIEMAGLSISGEGGFISANANEGSIGNAGNITIETRQLQMRDGAQIATSTLGEGNAGTITVKAENINMNGNSFTAEGEGFTTGILAQSDTAGNAGTVIIEALQLRVTDGAVVDVAADGAGDAGTIIVRANDVELLNGLDNQNSSALDASVKPSDGRGGSGTGSGGSVTVEAERLVLRNGGSIEARTANGSESGQVFIFATESVELSGTTPNSIVGSSIFTNTAGSADAGDITIFTGSLSIRDTSAIIAGSGILSDEAVTGNGGNISIFATDSVELIGGESEELGVGINSGTFGQGDAGNISIATNQLRVLDRAGISVSTSDENGGNAGEISINATESVELRGRLTGLTATTDGSGNAGNIDITTGQLSIRDRALIGVGSESSGIPGNINISANETFLENRAGLIADSEAGQGGSIRVQSNDIRLLNDSEMRATGSQSSQTFEGNIEIDANLLVLLQGSGIITDASNPTGGSNITIRPLGGSELAVLQSQNTTIRAAGELSIDDTLNFDPPESPEVTVVDPAALIAQDPCKLRGDSEFIITGRGGIASSPYDIFTGDRPQVSLVEPARSSQNRSTSTQRSRTEPNQPRSSADIIPARGWIRDENGDVILVSYDPTKTGVDRQPQQYPNQCHSEE